MAKYLWLKVLKKVFKKIVSIFMCVMSMRYCMVAKLSLPPSGNRCLSSQMSEKRPRFLKIRLLAHIPSDRVLWRRYELRWRIPMLARDHAFASLDQKWSLLQALWKSLPTESGGWCASVYGSFPYFKGCIDFFFQYPRLWWYSQRSLPNFFHRLKTRAITILLFCLSAWYYNSKKKFAPRKFPHLR